MSDWKKQGFTDFVCSVLDRFAKVDPLRVEKKRWGAAFSIGVTTYGQMSLAIIDKGGFCSRHYHNQKVNVFNVCEGELHVHVWNDELKCDTKKPDLTHVVKAGESLQIPINVIHEMEAMTDVVCMESYHTVQSSHKVCPKDIHRFTTGGMHR